jgi:histidyl-tRNA synthetase
MYQIKSGDEIVDQLFSFEDRGGRRLAIRPEITPTLARMVNQQINTLPRPIKWFSVPRLCRAERPQKGRLREFFQWNIDIIGIDDVLADAEIIFCALDYLQQAGLTQNDIVVRISSRRMLAEVLETLGVKEKQKEPLYAVLDKRNKVPEEAFAKMLDEHLDRSVRNKVMDLMNVQSLEQIAEIASLSPKAEQGIEECRRLFTLLTHMGVAPFCQFDITIVRGLAYYTGVVYEIYDRGKELRAIGGGGRYDNLLNQFGGPQVTATGLGMGDCVLGILLEEKGLLHTAVAGPTLDVFVACVDAERFPKALEIVARLRRQGYATGFSYKTTGLSKQLKQASESGARQCIIVGQEWEQGQLILKNMADGSQSSLALSGLYDGSLDLKAM